SGLLHGRVAEHAHQLHGGRSAPYGGLGALRRRVDHDLHRVDLHQLFQNGFSTGAASMAMILSLLLCSAFALAVATLRRDPTPTAVRSVADAHEWPVSVETLPNENNAEFEWFTAPSGERFWFPRKTRIVFSYEPEQGPLAAVQAAVAAHRSAGLSMDFRVES